MSAASPNYPPGYLDEYIGYRLTGVAIAFIVLNITFVTLRFVARRLGKVPMGIDDILIMPSLLTVLLLCADAFCEQSVSHLACPFLHVVDGRLIMLISSSSNIQRWCWASCSNCIEHPIQNCCFLQDPDCLYVGIPHFGYVSKASNSVPLLASLHPKVISRLVLHSHWHSRYNRYRQLYLRRRKLYTFCIQLG